MSSSHAQMGRLIVIGSLLSIHGVDCARVSYYMWAPYAHVDLAVPYTAKSPVFTDRINGLPYSLASRRILGLKCAYRLMNTSEKIQFLNNLKISVICKMHLDI
mgnify:CR=1 FL=1